MSQKEPLFKKELWEHRCVPCKGGVPPLKEARIVELLDELNGEDFKGMPYFSASREGSWTIERQNFPSADSHLFLFRQYEFPDFKQGLGLVEVISEKAEEEGHHPEITFGWGFVQIRMWTHKIEGLTESDFYMASKIEYLFQNNHGYARAMYTTPIKA